MPTVARNLLGNLVGRGLVAGLGLVLVPVYIHFLGIEAYGLVSFYVVLQTIFGILDLGLSTTASREIAIRIAHDERRAEARDLFRTLESIYWLVGIAVGVTIVAAAPFIASRWLQPESLSVRTVQTVVVLMGINVAVQWPYTIYGGALNGMQRIVEYNAVQTGMNIVRNVGAVVVVAWHPDVIAFYVWQLVVSVLTTGLFAAVSWKYMPAGPPPRARLRLLAGIWRFAAAMTMTTIFGVVLSHSDRIVLSNMLRLETFGYYSVAATIGSGLFYLMAPISLTFLPRFTELLAKEQHEEVARTYHLSAQIMTAVVVPVAFVLATFSREVIVLWTGSTLIASQAARIATVLLGATLLYAIMEIPYMLQLAQGRGRLAVYTNMTAAMVYLPLLIYMVPRYGAMGAAVPLLIVYGGKFLIWTHFVHAQVLRREKWRWYVQDVFIPAAAVLTVVWMARWLLPRSLFSKVVTGVPLLGIIVAAAAVAAAASAPQTRMHGLAILARLRRFMARGAARPQP